MAERRRRRRGGHSFGELTNIYNPDDDDDMAVDDVDIIRPIPIPFDFPAKKPKLTAKKLDVYEDDDIASDNDSENDGREPTQFNQEKEEKYDRTGPFQMIEPENITGSIRDEFVSVIQRGKAILAHLKDENESLQDYISLRSSSHGYSLMHKVRMGPSNRYFNSRQEELDHFDSKISKLETKINKDKNDLKLLITKANDMISNIFYMAPLTTRKATEFKQARIESDGNFLINQNWEYNFQSVIVGKIETYFNEILNWADTLSVITQDYIAKKKKKEKEDNPNSN
jgi:hypothetical protein